MPDITDPNEPYFKDGIWGWHAAGDRWIPVAADSATNYLLVHARGDIEVHQTTPADMRVAIHGWDGAAWRRLPLVFGYSEPYVERTFTTNATVTQHTLGLGAVPAGELWRIESASAYNNTTAIDRITIRTKLASVVTTLTRDETPILGQHTFWSGLVTLGEGTSIQAVFDGTVAGDDIYFNVRGYKMLIAE